MSNQGPAEGHQFHFAVVVQGSHQIVGDPKYYESELDPDAEPFTLTVRAWNLADACRVAGQAAFREWGHGCEEESDREG